MARARFVAAGHHNLVCMAFGQEFPHGKWVDLKGMDPEHVKTLSENPTFETELDPEPAAKKGKGAAAGTQVESSGESEGAAAGDGKPAAG